MHLYLPESTQSDNPRLDSTVPTDNFPNVKILYIVIALIAVATTLCITCTCMSASSVILCLDISILLLNLCSNSWCYPNKGQTSETKN